MKEEYEAVVLSICNLFLGVFHVVFSVIHLIHKSIFGKVVDSSKYNEQLKSILITGGSGGIGKELALQYAKPGRFLAITGTNETKLENVKRECETLGATVEICSISVTDSEKFVEWMLSVDDRYPFNLVVANAGVSATTSQESDLYIRVKKVTEVNIIGVVNTIIPAFDRMVSRKTGQIAIMSSLAGIFNQARSVSYSSSKVSVLTMGKMLRSLGRDRNVQVNVICPGYVVSGMTDAAKAKGRTLHGLWPVKEACEFIRQGLEENKGVIAFPFVGYLALSCLQNLPYPLQDFVRYLIKDTADLSNVG